MMFVGLGQLKQKLFIIVLVPCSFNTPGRLLQGHGLIVVSSLCHHFACETPFESLKQYKTRILIIVAIFMGFLRKTWVGLEGS
jgi:hypothetical protein